MDLHRCTHQAEHNRSIVLKDNASEYSGHRMHAYEDERQRSSHPMSARPLGPLVVGFRKNPITPLHTTMLDSDSAMGCSNATVTLLFSDR